MSIATQLSSVYQIKNQLSSAIESHNISLDQYKFTDYPSAVLDIRTRFFKCEQIISGSNSPNFIGKINPDKQSQLQNAIDLEGLYEKQTETSFVNVQAQDQVHCPYLSLTDSGESFIICEFWYYAKRIIKEGEEEYIVYDQLMDTFTYNGTITETEKIIEASKTFIINFTKPQDSWIGKQYLYNYTTDTYSLNDSSTSGLSYGKQVPIKGQVYSQDGLVQPKNLYPLDINKDKIKVILVTELLNDTNIASGYIVQDKQGQIWTHYNQKMNITGSVISSSLISANNIYVCQNNYIIGNSTGSGYIIPQDQLAFYYDLKTTNYICNTLQQILWDGTPTIETISSYNCMNFTGLSGQIYKRDAFLSGSEFTDSLQVYISGQPTTDTLLFGVGKKDSTNNKGRFISIGANSGVIFNDINIGTISPNQWHTITIAYKDNICSSFIDNSILSTWTYSNQLDNTGTNGGIGAKSSTTIYMKNIRSYNKALSLTEINALSKQI